MKKVVDRWSGCLKKGLAVRATTRRPTPARTRRDGRVNKHPTVNTAQKAGCVGPGDHPDYPHKENAGPARRGGKKSEPFYGEKGLKNENLNRQLRPVLAVRIPCSHGKGRSSRSGRGKPAWLKSFCGKKIKRRHGAEARPQKNTGGFLRQGPEGWGVGKGTPGDGLRVILALLAVNLALVLIF